MKVRNERFIMDLIVIVAALSGLCEKSYRQQREDYYRVGANMNMSYWQEPRQASCTPPLLCALRLPAYGRGPFMA